MNKHYDSRTLALAVTAVITAFLCHSAPVNTSGMAIYIAPNGNDSWSGKIPEMNSARDNGPFATLDRSRDEIRKIKASGKIPPGGITVFLRAGNYPRTAAFVLTPEDSGTADSPIVYTAYKNERVVINGCVSVDGFEPVTDAAVLARIPPGSRASVMRLSLPKRGMTNYGAFGAQSRPTAGLPMEFFASGKPMTLARWPNEGFVAVASAPAGEKGGMFGYTDDRPMRWTNEKDARGNGYWMHDWHASHAAFLKIDTEKRIIYTKPPHANYGYRKGGRYFAYNILSELDMPGEWYLDRSDGMLYFWPPDADALRTGEVSVAVEFVSAAGCAFVSFRGLVVQGFRNDAMTFKNTTNVSIIGCTLRNISRRAVVIDGGVNAVINGCDIYDTGEGALSITGGDRKKLIPARHSVENNVITRFNRLQRAYAPAVALYAVGCRVAHNLMYDSPHVTVLFGGNDNIIEYNEVHSMGYECGEMGAFYCGRNWTLTGNILRYNYVHDIYNPCPQRNRGFMLDDGAAGLVMIGNIFSRVAEGISLSSINNRIENNIFKECYPAVGCWGGELSFPPFDPKAGHNPTMWPPLEELALDTPPWSERFPEMRKLREAIKTGGAVPEECRTRITGNIIVGGDPEYAGFHVTKEKSAWVIENNSTNIDPRFIDARNGDFRLKPDSPAVPGWTIAEHIGVVASDDRASWPVNNTVRPGMPTNFVYVAPAAAARGTMPVLKIYRLAGTPVIDGVLSENEWTMQPVSIEQDVQGDTVFSPSRLWIGWDDEALYAAFSNPVNAATAMALDTVWGKSEASEIAIQKTGDTKAPIILLRGFAKGTFVSSREAMADEASVARASNGVSFAAKQVNASLWTCEWRIPFTSLGVSTKFDRRFLINFTVRKVADGLWVMWAGTGAHSYDVDKAGRCVLVDASKAVLYTLDDAEGELQWSGGASLSETNAKDGRRSIRFDASDKRGITLKGFNHDLSAYERMSFDCFSEKNTGALLDIIASSVKADGTSGAYFRYRMTVNWKGWKHFDIPFGEFEAAHYPVGWQKINTIDFNTKGWGHEPVAGTVLYIDNMMLGNE